MRQIVMGVVLFFVGCGDSGPIAPTTPTAPRFPQVAGTYSGTLSLSPSDSSGVLSVPAQLTVIQAGSQLTISGSMTLMGQNIDVAAVTGTINETGFFTVAESGSFTGPAHNPTCGNIVPTSGSLTFSGNMVRLVQTAVTDYCGNWQLDGTLTRL